MPKIYILDTNALLQDPRALLVLEENSVVTPLAVVKEIDNQGRSGDEIGRNARIVSRVLDSLRMNGQISSGVQLPNQRALQVEVNHQEAMVSDQ
jgi:PhoH-like ATPase